jgi:tetratricopeptide (TPR) repeat protein
VREDIFAGLLANDMDRLKGRMEKLELAVKNNPNVGNLAWKGAGDLILAVHAHEAGKADEFKSYYEAAVHTFAQAERLAEDRQLGPNSAGLYDISGAAWGGLADRLPASVRTAAYEAAYRSWDTALRLSQARLTIMTPHGRGEMLAGLAQSAQRTGRTEEARRRLTEMVVALPGTVFEERAKTWLDKPELMKATVVSCQSCHPQERFSSVTTKSR